ncbi:hypothetical protein [Leeuwenhoekiella sp. NPDC079379]|uniref:hypothetical protein n=1 Tax=Leeuwenhoekiella sp. NPDC079379 TaxID=3364122 RepID=UPI0037C718C4
MNKLILILFIPFLFNSCVDAPKRLNKKMVVDISPITVVKDSKFLWSINGSVRNIANKEIKGYIKVKYLNSENDIIGDAKAHINQGDYFRSGQSVLFKINKDPKELESVEYFDVQFIEN